MTEKLKNTSIPGIERLAELQRLFNIISPNELVADIEFISTLLLEYSNDKKDHRDLKEKLGSLLALKITFEQIAYLDEENKL